MKQNNEQVSNGNNGAEGAAGFFPLDRFNAFSDGVFAIVITLLVIELPVPPEGAPVLAALAASWPDFLGYAISFAFVGGIWLSHAGLTKYMTRGDAAFFRLNLVMLLFVALLPFATHLMVTHLEAADASAAVVIYGINLLVASGMITALLYYVEHDRYLVEDNIADDLVKRAYRQRRTYLILTALAILVALFAPLVAVASYIFLAVGFLIQPLLGLRRKH
jgi:uncharacterized membrane protein